MLIVAAGRGSRAGEGLPKQYRTLGGEPVLTRTLRAALACADIDAALVVIHPDDEALFQAAAARLPEAMRARLLPPVMGGPTRAASVALGLAAIEAGHDVLVGVHDGARPFLTPELTARVFAAADRAGAAIPATAVTDTIKQVEGGTVRATPDRAALRAVQTPQAFRLGLLRAAYAALGDFEASDDASVVERAGHAVRIVDGDPGNIKLTTQADFDMAEQRLARALVTRVGTGYDVHAFTDGDHVTCAAIASRIRAAFWPIRTATWPITRCATRSSARLAKATSAGTFRPPTRAGRARPPPPSCASLANARRRAAGGSTMSTSPSSARPPDRAPPRGDAGAADGGHRPRTSPGRVEGHHLRAPRIHRPRRRAGRARDRHAAPAGGRPMSDARIRALAIDVLEACKARGLMLATAESCTGGLVAGALTDIAGSSAVVERGFVTYSNEAKSELLGVPAELIAAHGAVSREVALAMAAGALARSRAGLAVSITGVAGPGGGSAAKPVGLVHFACARAGGESRHLERRYGDLGREAVRREAVIDALTLLLEGAKG